MTSWDCGFCQFQGGTPSARKRALFHNTLAYAVERDLLPANPISTVQWHAPKATAAVSPPTVTSGRRFQGSRQLRARSLGLSDPAPTVAHDEDAEGMITAEHEAGDRLAPLLLPYRRERDEEDGPGHELGWRFTDAPPAVVREALALVSKPPGERPNYQPPEEWLVAQAARRGGVLAGFAAPAGPASPRVRADAGVVPCSQAEDLASEIASALAAR